MKVLIVTLLLFFQSPLVFSQEKIEVEKKVDRSNFPAPAVAFVESLFPNQKVHWIQEQGKNHTSFEAKLTHKKKKYSIEFDKYGRFEDIEFIVSEEQLPGSVFKKIHQTLNNDFEQFEINKVQEQWIGNRDQIESSLKKEKAENKIQQRYELVVYAKLEATYQKFEYLFDANGVYIQKQKISESNHDNFFY